MAEAVSSKADFDKISIAAGSGLLVAHFWAAWSEPSKLMNEVVDELAKEHQSAKFLKIEAESVPDVTVDYNVSSVPTFVFLRSGKEVDRLTGANAPELSKKVAQHAGVVAEPNEGLDLESRLKQLVRADRVMIFMKGTVEEPRCGFSRKMVNLLNGKGVAYSTFNILADQAVREGLKKFSNWPSYPQVYIDGELVGGLDIVQELEESGELDDMLPKKVSLEDRLKQVINSHPIMLFMKGSSDAPRCGFSKTICGILNETGVKYSTFDILQDEEVRQGLKKYSDWPSYPQLYIKGELIGGLDIVKELKESNELLTVLESK
ncbi:glutaredoxin-3-like [Oscarella lobularis]|uniref:glutaredoxin-3-like n=1 Tax=Oscarella lobularis TaxID=121494 RepID=UPI0033141513